MKTIKFLSVIFILINSFSMAKAQTNDYASDWKKVEDFDKKGLPKSALDLVVKIFNDAVAKGNSPQQIKAAMYQMRYRNQVELDNSENNIFYLDTLIAKTKAPAKNILQSMQAQLFWNYQQNNRWKFYNRTQLAEEKSKDISTWSLQKLQSTASQLYRQSLSDEAILKTTDVSKFYAVIDKGQNTQGLRPKLYDFLAHRALDFFVDTENDVTQPAYKFILNDEKLFAPANDFVNYNFTTRDSLSNYYHAVKILQDVLKFHLNDAQPDAMIDADLRRLDIINEHGVFTNKEKLYEAALLAIEKKYPNSEAIAEAMWMRAQLYSQAGEDDEQPTKKADLRKAKALYDEIINRFPKSNAAIKAKNAVAGLTKPSFQIKTEEVNLPDMAMKALVEYTNTDKLFFRIIKVSREERKAIFASQYDDNNAWWKTVISKPALRNWEQSLPAQSDYHQHSVEVKIDALPSGSYILLAGLKQDFGMSENILAVSMLYVSNISYLFNDKGEVNVLHRNSGMPLANANIQVWQSEYNYSTRLYSESKLEQMTTNKNGFAKLTTDKNNRYNKLLQISWQGDELFTDDQVYTYYYDGYRRKAQRRSFLFTDRSIYRPGQTVFFKGIIINTDSTGRKSDVVPGVKTEVILYDANNQKQGTLQLTSNQYGSYNGSFKLPEGQMNGQFFISDTKNNGNVYFSVEEYKRPKFITEIKKPVGIYKVNDSITVTGNAKAYAGNNVDGAMVKYRVVRKVQYPIWYWGWYRKMWPPYGGSEEMEISNGISETDANGDFKITFKGIPDETVDRKNQPIFIYEVSADVTDINGETRSGNTQVKVSYQALQLNILGNDKLSTDSVHTLKITSTNINDLHQKATVTMKMYALQSPNKIYRKRYWNKPDSFIMTKEEHDRYFPYDAYKDEDDMTKWALGKEVLSITDTTAKDGKFNIPKKSFAQGWYKIIVTNISNGDTVKAEKFVLLTAPGAFYTDAPIAVEKDKATAQPGEKINYNIVTGFDKIWLVQSLTKPEKQATASYSEVLAGKPYRNTIDVTENERGGMGLNYAFVKNNRVYQGNEIFTVPWTNKELNISFETFRDKTLPGSEEKWTVKITGSKAEKVNAEMLVSMYDASLDQFKPHQWNSLMNLWPTYGAAASWRANTFEQTEAQVREFLQRKYDEEKVKTYNEILDNGWNTSTYNPRRMKMPMAVSATSIDLAKESIQDEPYGAAQSRGNNLERGLEAKASGLKMARDTSIGDVKSEDTPPPAPEGGPDIRKNFNETAFFFPELTTDANGNISFSFTMPEALTKWKTMVLAHTPELASAFAEKSTITQKQLMVQPNPTRFVREGDDVDFSAKIVNMSEKEMTGTATLQLFDAATNKPVDGWFKNVFPTQYFTAGAGQSTVVKFPMSIPYSFGSALTYRIVAKCMEGADGEEATQPVLTNRMLVTETLPLNMRNTDNKNFKFEKLLNANNSGTLAHQSLTVEFTTNPTWYAVQALPYLMEYPYECAEQNFNRYYANVLASHIANSYPKIKAVFEKWKNADTTALMSNLQKNEELKYALLQETPWVLEAQNEAQQKKNIALLFDLVRLSKETDKTLAKLKEMQSSNGGFVWFKGGPDDRFITQYIIAGIGHLRKLNAISAAEYTKLKPVVDKAIPYLDARIAEDYDRLLRSKVKLDANNLWYASVHYLYTRSFFKEYAIAAGSKTAVNYYSGQAKKYWLSQSKYVQGMIALALNRDGDSKTPQAIIKSLKENAIVEDELGMYWKDFVRGGYYWYQAPIESQALMIEAFTDIDKNVATINDMKTWLLKQKQVQNWKSTKATAEACYALLLNGSNWLATERDVTIQLGGLLLTSSQGEGKKAVESGTGYFKERIEGAKVQQGMGNINVQLASPAEGSQNAPSGGKGGAWGAVYWQYFENLDKITFAETPLKLSKKLFVERNSDRGPVLDAVTDNKELKIGDKIKVRIELRVDRDMEYVHMKDMRAAGFEPVNVLSQYKWQGGLGYYESTKDASTNFFFHWLPRGTYVFEYPMFVTHSGNFSNGITTIQCMYAPEFTAHSEGVRVRVEDK